MSFSLRLQHVCGTALFLFFSSQESFAFPSLSRHGYPNCTACHVSPSGGGLLNDYGRELSKELLSAWAFEGEQKTAYGALPEQERVLLGAFFRGVQFHRENKSIRQGYPILMQADFEAAVQVPNVTIVGSIGRQEMGSPSQRQGRVWSRRHYVLARLNENNLRFGKFQRNFGFGDPDHRLYVKTVPGFIQDHEAYNVEYSYAGETVGVNLTHTFEALASRTVGEKMGGTALSLSYFFFEHDKVGFSLFRGSLKKKSPQKSQETYSPWALAQWTPSIYSQHEFLWNSIDNLSPSKTTDSFATTHKIHYEMFQGIIPFLAWEWLQDDRLLAVTQKQSWEIGFDFYPRPHFEFQLAAQREVKRSKSEDPDYLLWLMANFYL